MYGYSDFSLEKDENTALNRLLEENTAKGLLYISDFDARAADGLHPVAHLWDNGKEAGVELKNVLAIRQKALANFSEKNITIGTPMSRLEDVLVPVYNYHRYQLEAVCKLIGGMDYSYSVRGDKQQTPKILDNAVQKAALTAAIDCLDPSVLALPENVLQIIPPRPPEYYGFGEMMPKRSGSIIDPLAAAEALTNYEFAFLFNPQRANRLVAFKSRNNTIGFDDVADAVIEKTWKAPLSKGLENQVQLQTQQMVVTFLLGLNQSELSNYAVKSIAYSRLQSIKQLCETQLRANTTNRAHFEFTIERIDKPKDIVLPTHRDMPPGAPIGCDWEN